MSDSFQIYRFEVARELSRSPDGANVVYEARDPVSNSTLHLYEWTPPARDAASSSEQFSTAMAELDGAEAFTLGCRYYLAADDARVKAALTTLRSHSLFSGSWPGLFESIKTPSPELPPQISDAFQIYRFEVARELSRSPDGANVVYEARDPVSNSTLHLYEWTPPARDAASSSEQFSTAMAELDGAEAFTLGCRYYLAADDARVKAALTTLRSHSLFSGFWPGLFESTKTPSELLPETIESQTLQLDVVAQTTPRKRLWRASVFLVTTAAVAALAWYWWGARVGSGATQPPAPILGIVADGRPAPVSLLNPPVLRRTTPAQWDPRNIHGIVVLESGEQDPRLKYPDGSQYVLGSKFYSASGKPSIALNERTGTLTVTSSDVLVEQKSSQQWSVQIPTDQMRDINGDGFPEIVLEDYSGGAHCCTHVTVISLRPKGPVCIFSEDIGSASVSFSRLTADRRVEIVTTHLAEYALGSFATGTYGIPVIYSAGSDGAYQVNTRAFVKTLNADRDTDLAELSTHGPDFGPEQEDSARANLFFLDYLTDRKTDAYQWLKGLVATEELSVSAVLSKIEDTLNAAAPEVLNEPDWNSLRTTLTPNQSQTSSTDASSPATPSESIQPKTAVSQVIQTWVQSFRNKDADAHAACYAPIVETFFKMHNVPNDRILQYKRKAFSELQAIRQYEISQMYVSAPINDRIFATFLKEWDTPTTFYPVYSGKETERLTFANFGGNWRIVAEEEVQIIEVNRQPAKPSSPSVPDSRSSTGTPADLIPQRDQSYSDVHLSLQNECAKVPIYIVLRYDSAQGWITRGWFVAKALETMNVVLPSMRQNSVFFVYAQAVGMKWDGRDDKASYSTDIVDDIFIHRDGESLYGHNKRTISMFSRQATENGPVRFSCR